MKALALALTVLASGAAAECRDDRVTIKGGFGEAHIAVQVADNEGERAQGLMNVPRMGTLQGMLFVYDAPETVAFWMHDTLIPLDMIFAGADGTITRVHENAKPMDDTPIPRAGTRCSSSSRSTAASPAGSASSPATSSSTPR
ncbi:exported protein [Rubellimicrobium mesophilum DSM 19309]|uniref:Exported protein n=1 Tax=Rubellimicrobium mesophilum DSM 19309 TaxID=442562 RepID=A0A017HUQ0_9RHOB|nr:exported protein [Rubellimicrobium mesophilum DSM 19309]